MTATHVNGIAVVVDQPAESPISRPGVNVVFEKIRHLLLADGAEMYGCSLCDYTSENKLSIRPHLKVHKPRTPDAPKPKKKAQVVIPSPATVPANGTRRVGGDLASLSLGQLVEQAQLTDQMRHQRDVARAEAEAARRETDDWKERAADYRSRCEGWKGRAEKAEATMRNLREFLQP
ncbi:hypothetical protein [Streptomyces sp. NPDC001889]